MTPFIPAIHDSTYDCKVAQSKITGKPPVFVDSRIKRVYLTSCIDNERDARELREFQAFKYAQRMQRIKEKMQRSKNKSAVI